VARGSRGTGRKVGTGRKIGMTLLALLLIASVTMIGLLLRDDGLVRLRPPEATPAPRPLEGLVAAAFDPEGTGPPGENNHLVQLALDGDRSTGWRTESYERADFGTKDGVGLLLDLGGPKQLDSMSIYSPTQGWAASVHVSQDPPAAAPLEAGFTLTPTGTDSGLVLRGTTGRYLLIWITDLGRDGAKHRVELNEVAVLGATVDGAVPDGG